MEAHQVHFRLIPSQICGGFHKIAVGGPIITFKLPDIDASTSVNLDYGKGFTPIGNITTKFTGSYDGQSYYIDNLHISRPQGTEIGLFGYANFATVKNINLFQPNITGDIRVGSIVGELINSSGQFIGNHVYEGFVKGNTTTGGLVGRLGNNSHIHASSYTGTTTGYTSSQNFTGGGDPSKYRRNCR